MNYINIRNLNAYRNVVVLGIDRTERKLERSDSDLVLACLAGENSAFDELVRRYQKQIFNYCCHLLGNGDDASDATSEAFIKAYDGLECFRYGAPFAPWIYKIARNCCLDKKRAQSRQRTISLETQLESGWQPSDELPMPEQQVETGIDNDRLKKAIDNLPEKYKNVIVLKHFQDLEIKDISQVLGIPEGTVKANLHRGRKLLRGILSKEEGGAQMNCRRASHLIQDYLDGNVSANISVELKSHLDNCLACSQESATYQQIINMLEANKMQDPPAHLFTSIRAKLPERHPASQGGKMGRMSCYMVWATGTTPAGLMAWVSSGLTISYRTAINLLSKVGQILKPLADFINYFSK